MDPGLELGGMGLGVMSDGVGVAGGVGVQEDTMLANKIIKMPNLTCFTIDLLIDVQ